ncbi:MAG: hypothetical protein E3K32_11190 [wastewater metagenome]|nr:hypothetical protein [Candidatus Loosdrechtia aerotolerans]
MKLENGNHLMYCLNIHHGEHFDEILAAIEDYSLKVKERICPDKDFGLGLRLSHTAVQEFLTRIKDFKTVLERNKLYVVTINGFPFGPFHGTRIKEHVYLPDWSSLSRVAYTCGLARIISCILPEGETGTISTVPSHYGREEKPSVIFNLLKVVDFLEEIEKRTGKHIILSLEPEPDCYLDTLHSVIDFFENIFRRNESAKRYLGICLDCCHVLVEFESPLHWFNKLTECGILVNKVQISSALRTVIPYNPLQALASFHDEEYLHQVRILSDRGVSRFRDLPDALTHAFSGEWRVHFHIPLTWSGTGVSSTINLIEDEFFRQVMICGKKHIEVETYSYNLLPGIKPCLIDSITSELEWVKERLGSIGKSGCD